MSIAAEPALPSRPHIVVVGNHKGGSGKSTVAMHLIVALLKAGKRVASFDLDLTQQTLSHYLENRYAWAQQNKLMLELPHHYSIVDDCTVAFERDPAADFAWFTNHLATIEREGCYDFILIDTPGGLNQLSVVAHGMADTLVTPINDSLLDLDVIVAIGPSREVEPQASAYARTVARAVEGRQLVSGRPTDWIVVRNRLGTLASHNEHQVAELLESVRTKLGFRTARGLTERLVFREFFAQGLTAFDQMDRAVLGTKPSPANLIARLEVRNLVDVIGLLPKQDEAERASGAEAPAGDLAAQREAVQARTSAERRAKRRRRRKYKAPAQAPAVAAEQAPAVAAEQAA
jgi:chromosome partitioning protein